MIFKLTLADNTILLCFLFFFLIIELYFSTHADNLQYFKSIAELLIPKRIPIKTTREEIEIRPVTTEAKLRKCSL